MNAIRKHENINYQKCKNEYNKQACQYNTKEKTSKYVKQQNHKT